MGDKEQEYKEMFYAEAHESFEELNTLLTVIEKNPEDTKAIDSIFRITHTLKGNAMGLGFQAIAELSHVMEDLFVEIKAKRIELTTELCNNLFKANDKLGALINALKTDARVSYKGIRTKLEVYLKNARKELEEAEGEQKEDAIVPVEAQEVQVIVEDKLSEESDDDEEEEVAISFSDQIQIPVKKLDNLMTLVGELIIEKDSLIARGKGQRRNEFSRLHRITSDLQYGVMGARLVQVGFLFNKFHRIIRDVASIEKKEVDLVLQGTDIEIDRNILKIMSDSLVHLIRNAVSHGIESPEEREKAGKQKTGKVILRARNEKDTVFIEVEDDGAGIETEKIRKKAVEKGMISESDVNAFSDDDIRMLIFEPGFSNAEKITEVSGRGVGMDVVKRATESIGGKILLDSTPGKGSVITLSLPSSMAVKGALLFEMKGQEFAIALSYTEAVVSLRKNEIHKVSNGLISTYLDKTISVVFLDDLYQMENLNDVMKEGVFHRSFNELKDNRKLDVIIVSYNDRFLGLVVDKLLQQKEIVEKTLTRPLDTIKLFSGATILGNGNVCLVLDIVSIIGTLFKGLKTNKRHEKHAV